MKYEGKILRAEPAEGILLAAVQMDVRIGRAEENAAACRDALHRAAGEGAALVAYPECALTGYCFSSLAAAREAALEPDSPVLRGLARASAETGVALAVGYLERTPSGVANTVSLIGPRGEAGRYRKTHLPHLGVDRFATAGQEPFRVFELGGLRVGLLICYDASFPEASRLLALAGADLILLPTNWPEEAEQKANWLPNARAYENVVYFASVNRVGMEEGYRFHGLSRICGPAGETLVQGPRDEPALLLAPVDPKRARTKRIERRGGEYWVDRMGDRRLDLYHLSAKDPSREP